jgi:hypothetical protein
VATRRFYFFSNVYHSIATRFLRFGQFRAVFGFPTKLTKTNLSRVSGKMRKHFSVRAGSAVLSGFKQVFKVFQAQKP